MQGIDRYWYRTGVSRIQVKFKKVDPKKVLFVRCTTKKTDSLRIFQFDVDHNRASEVRVGFTQHMIHWRSIQLGKDLFLTGGSADPRDCIKLSTDGKGVF